MEKAEVETVDKVTLSCCLKNVRKEASKQTQALGVRLTISSCSNRILVQGISK